MKLAELNVGYTKYPTDDPRMAGFMDNLDRINALAERSPGFVWRMKSDSGNATDIEVPGDDDIIANMSVWADVASLGHFVFNTVHAQFYNQKHDWFRSISDPYFVMWWIEDDHTPTLAEAMDRLATLRAAGSTPEAFGWDYVDTTAWRRCDLAAE